jgi:hypothetical protein
MKLEPFNLERALAGDEVVTRDGLKVKQLTYFECATNEKSPLIAVLNKQLKFYELNGTHHYGQEEFDLFMKPKVNRIWINVYKNKYGKIYTGVDRETKEDALAMSVADEHYIKTIEITDEVE